MLLRFPPALRFLLLLGLAAAAPALAEEAAPAPQQPAELDCAKEYQALGISRPRVGVGLYEPKLNHDRIILHDQEFYDPNAVYLSMESFGARGSVHFSLVAGKQKFEAYPFFAPSTIDQYGSGKIPLSRHGSLFEIKFSPEMRQKIEEAMAKNEGSKNLTCLHGVCRVLRDAGLDIHLPGGKVRARAFLINLLDGKLSEGSTPLDPSQMRLLAPSEKELKNLLEDATSMDETMAKNIRKRVLQEVEKRPLYLALPAVVPAGLVWVLHEIRQPGSSEKKSEAPAAEQK